MTDAQVEAKVRTLAATNGLDEVDRLIEWAWTLEQHGDAGQIITYVVPGKDRV
jgi:hypothetical protein